MEWLKNLIIKVAGKYVDKYLEKWGVSKTKVIAIVMALIKASEILGPAFGFEVNIPTGVFEVLAALGLWSLRDGIESAKKNA